MTTETINGLHSCKPGNDPIVGQVKLFVIEHRQGKSGKPYIKIKSANAENGGTPHRILGAEKTDFVDKYGNNSYNLEVEPSSNSPSVFQSPQARFNGGDGVSDTRKHLMKVANLYNLCIAAVDKAIAPNLPEIARTSEQFQATLASLFIEASSRRTTDGVNWWSYVDRMPDTPLAQSQSQQGKPRSTAPLSPKIDCTCENTDGDNPLCPVHSE